MGCRAYSYCRVFRYPTASRILDGDVDVTAVFFLIQFFVLALVPVFCTRTPGVKVFYRITGDENVKPPVGDMFNPSPRFAVPSMEAFSCDGYRGHYFCCIIDTRDFPVTRGWFCYGYIVVPGTYQVPYHTEG